MFKSFWRKALWIANYLLNRSPITILSNKTPIEIWLGISHNLSYLCVFGCAYAHSFKIIDWIKFSHKKCTFLGHFKKSKVYWLMGKFDKRLITCKNVIFEGSYLKLIFDKKIVKEDKDNDDLLLDLRFF